MTQQKSTTTNKSTAFEIIELLKADHKKVKALFDEFEEARENGSSSKKEKIVKQICEELTIHALAEESIVYPAAREVIKDEDLMDEAEVEHAGAKELISQLQSMSSDDSHYDAKVVVLREYIEHHVKEEETNMFPKLAKSKIDGSEMAEEVEHFKENQESKKSSKKNQNDEPDARSNKRSSTLHRKSS